jgi:hypothetical protein
MDYPISFYAVTKKGSNEVLARSDSSKSRPRAGA